MCFPAFWASSTNTVRFVPPSCSTMYRSRSPDAPPRMSQPNATAIARYRSRAVTFSRQ